jgi:hypothetical protein
VLLGKGVAGDRIIFINLITVPEASSRCAGGSRR